MPTTARDQVRLLLSLGETLTPALADDIIALGAAAVPHLIELVEDDSLSMETAPGEGYAPVHAVTLLARLGAVEAAEPLVRTLARTGPDELLRNEIVVRGPAFGAAVVEPALALLAMETDEELRPAVLELLAKAGVRDDRIRAHLLNMLVEDPFLGALYFADYGDPTVLPDLSAAFDAHDDDEPGLFANQALVELDEAIRRLGGTLTAEQAARMEAIDARRRDAAARMRAPLEGPVRKAPSPGRNAPCRCGSGKKYKKCHLAEDEAAGR